MQPVVRTHRLPVVAVIVAVLLAVPAFAQKGEPDDPGQFGPSVHFLLKPLLEQPTAEIPEILRDDFGGRQGRHLIDGRPALSLVLQTSASRDELEAVGAVVRAQGETWATINILPELLPELVARQNIYSISIPRKFKRILETSVPGTGADHLRSESSGVWTGTTGAGVIIGVVDSGLDLTHPNFQDPFGNTRVLFMLDQTPAGADIECTAAQIDGGTCGLTDDTSGHGTHVTGIAAGNGAAVNANGNAYESAGVAPDADIIAVKTSFFDDDIIDAITYIFDKANSLGKPAVVNLSLGGHAGAHDGTDPIEQHIDAMVTAQNGRAVVIAAGNERPDEIHAEVKTLALHSVIGPDFEIAPYAATPGVGNDLVVLAGYYPGNDDLIVHLWTPSGEYLTQPLVTGPADCEERNTADGYIWLCNNANSILGQATTANEIVVAIFDRNPNTNAATAPPGAGAWGMGLSGMVVQGGQGEADFWTFGTADTTFTSHVDQEETVGMPGTAEHGITVGSYNTKVCWQAQNGTTYGYWPDFGISTVLTDVSWFSSWGPTRDGRLKPDISAPGAAIVSARAATAMAQPFFYINPDYLMMQGTSQAAPHVTGAVALMLEGTPTASAATLKSNLLNNTSQSYFSLYTGAPGTVWDVAFGHGILDLSFLGSDPWETNDSLGHAQQVVSGEVITGKISDLADEDHFQVTGMASGDVLRADLTGLPANYDLQVQQVTAIGIACNNSGPMITVEGSSTNSGTTDEVVVASPGWWFSDYMRVYSGGGFDATNTYTLKGVVTRPETTSPHNNTGNAQVLPEMVEFRVNGTTNFGGEHDYYRLSADSGETITADLPTGAVNHDVVILNSSGSTISSLGNSVSASATYTGVYYARVQRMTAGGTLSYQVHLGVN